MRLPVASGYCVFYNNFTIALLVKTLKSHGLSE